jgi:hypothetical protein
LGWGLTPSFDTFDPPICRKAVVSRELFLNGWILEDFMLKSQGIGILFIMIATLGLASLACRLGTKATTSTPAAQAATQITAPQVPNTPSPVKTTAPEQPAAEGQPAPKNQPTANPGKLSISIDEAQLNSMVATEFNKQNNPELINPKIHLQNGQILVSGEVNRSGLNASFSGTLTVEVTPDGHLQYTVVSASLGPLPLPQAMRDQIATQLNNILGTPQTKDGQQIYVENVNIGNGEMTITGHIR